MIHFLFHPPSMNHCVHHLYHSSSWYLSTKTAVCSAMISSRYFECIVSMAWHILHCYYYDHALFNILIRQS